MSQDVLLINTSKWKQGNIFTALKVLFFCLFSYFLNTNILKLDILFCRTLCITGWIVKTLLFPFSKIIKYWYPHILLFNYFVLVLFLLVFVTIPHVFLPHCIKGFLHNSTFHYFVGSVKTGTRGKTLWHEKFRGKCLWGKDFLGRGGGEIPKHTIDPILG